MDSTKDDGALVSSSPSTEEQAAGGSVGTNIAQATAPAWKIHPKAPRKVKWDVFVASLVVYSAVTVPFRVAFNEPAQGFWEYFDAFVDLMFALDMALNFFTGYERKDGNLEFGTVHIAWNYLFTWFGIDFLSTVPLDRIMSAAQG